MLSKTILKRLIAPLAVLAVGLVPALPSHASSPHAIIVINGVSFTQGTTSSGCTGPLVAVYGSSAISGLITSSSTAFCTSQIAGGTPAASAIDVEYNTSGDSCPGPNWAATDNTPGDPILAPSDAFSPSCAASGFQVSPLTEITLNGSGGMVANEVTAVTSCPGAVGPSGQVAGASGFPASFGLANTPCLGRSPIAGGVCSFPAGQPYSYFDTDMSVNAAQQLWSGSYSDLKVLNGCPGVAPHRQERITGSGTRITWCYNIFGFAGDNTPNCDNGTAAGGAPTTGTMLKDVCGIGNGGVPIDPVGTIGYASRNGTYKNTFLNCDLIGLGGLTAWNGQCDATAVRTVAQPYSGVNTESNTPTCNGDLQVTSGRYPAWGYIHMFGHGSGFTFPAQVLSYLAYLFGPNSGSATAPNYTSAPTNLQEATLQGAGFILKCQMTQSRSFDGGPYSAVTNASC